MGMVFVLHPSSSLPSTAVSLIKSRVLDFAKFLREMVYVGGWCQYSDLAKRAEERAIQMRSPAFKKMSSSAVHTRRMKMSLQKRGEGGIFILPNLCDWVFIRIWLYITLMPQIQMTEE